MESKCRFGILGCANIAVKNSKAIISSKNARLIAVASRSIEKCVKWCHDNDIPSDVIKYGCYEDLLQNPEIDAVYIPVPSKLHLVWIVKAAQHQKHILCDKPAAVNADDLDEMLDTCNKFKIQFMDGVMFMHHDRLAQIQNTLRDPYFGKVSRVDSVFCFRGTGDFLTSDIRVKASGDPLGAMGDLGWYCIRMGLVAFNYQQPFSVEARCYSRNEEGVPLDCVGRVYFDRNSRSERVLSFRCSFLAPFRQYVEISSEGAGSLLDKVLVCDEFVLPRSKGHATWTIETLTDEIPPSQEPVNYRTTHFCQQEVQMFETFSSIVLSKKREPFWPAVARLTQLVTDACMESMVLDGGEVKLPDVANTPMEYIQALEHASKGKPRIPKLLKKDELVNILQTEFEASKGNCLQAVVATLFGLNHEDFTQNGGSLPNFITHPEGYEKALRDWGRSCGYSFTKISLTPSEGKLPHSFPEKSLCILRGTSPRGNYGHATVGEVQEDGITVLSLADPHPDGTMLDVNEPLVWAGFFSSL